mgnify:CR=1 FL=1
MADLQMGPEALTFLQQGINRFRHPVPPEFERADILRSIFNRVLEKIEPVNVPGASEFLFGPEMTIERLDV